MLKLPRDRKKGIPQEYASSFQDFVSSDSDENDQNVDSRNATTVAQDGSDYTCLPHNLTNESNDFNQPAEGYPRNEMYAAPNSNLMYNSQPTNQNGMGIAMSSNNYGHTYNYPNAYPVSTYRQMEYNPQAYYGHSSAQYNQLEVPPQPNSIALNSTYAPPTPNVSSISSVSSMANVQSVPNVPSAPSMRSMPSMHSGHNRQGTRNRTGHSMRSVPNMQRNPNMAVPMYQLPAPPIQPPMRGPPRIHEYRAQDVEVDVKEEESMQQMVPVAGPSSRIPDVNDYQLRDTRGPNYDYYQPMSEQWQVDNWDRMRYTQVQPEWALPLEEHPSEFFVNDTREVQLHSRSSREVLVRDNMSVRNLEKSRRNATAKNRYRAFENLFILLARETKNGPIPWGIIPKIMMYYNFVSDSRNSRNMQVHYSQNVNPRLRKLEDFHPEEREQYNLIMNEKLENFYSGVMEEFKKINRVEPRPELVREYTRHAILESKRKLNRSMAAARQLKEEMDAKRKNKK